MMEESLIGAIFPKEIPANKPYGVQRVLILIIYLYIAFKIFFGSCLSKFKYLSISIMSSGEARNIASFISWLFIKDFIKRAISSQCCSELIFCAIFKDKRGDLRK
ncbi:hypothetical protein D3C86_1439570 [compost metagenome]